MKKLTLFIVLFFVLGFGIFMTLHVNAQVTNCPMPVNPIGADWTPTVNCMMQRIVVLENHQNTSTNCQMPVNPIGADWTPTVNCLMDRIVVLENHQNTSTNCPIPVNPIGADWTPTMTCLMDRIIVLESNYHLTTTTNTGTNNCASTTQPWIKVLSQNTTGISYTVGQTISVKWETCNIPLTANMTLDIINPTDSMDYPGYTTVSNSGQSSYLIPSKNISNPNSTFPAHLGKNVYKVRVDSKIPSLSYNLTALSDYFFTINGTGGITSNNTGVVVTPISAIKKGTTSAEVKTIQSVLKTQGYFTGNTTGYFGDITAKAVSTYQKAKGLPVTGTVDATTKASIISITPKIEPVPLPPVKITPTTSGFPAGCASNSGYSLTTGQTCASGANLISYWYGKVNQHISTTGSTIGSWVTDPDGVSGANLDMLTYCQKWYPNTTSVEPFINQTLTNWQDRGNVGAYANIKMAYKCVGSSSSVVSCTDSDGGINLSIAGFTDGRVNGIGASFNDESVGVNGGQCTGTNCTGVAEGYCENNVVKNFVYQCPPPNAYSVNGVCILN